MTVLFLAWFGAQAAEPIYPDCDPTRGNQPCILDDEDAFDPWRPWASVDWLLPAGSMPLGGPRPARPLSVYDVYPFRPHPTTQERELANPLKPSDLPAPPTPDVFTGPAPIPPFP